MNCPYCENGETKVVDTRVAAHDMRDRLTTLVFGGGELIVPHLDVPIGERVRTRIRARDVALSLQRPAGLSDITSSCDSPAQTPLQPDWLSRQCTVAPA